MRNRTPTTSSNRDPDASIARRTRDEISDSEGSANMRLHSVLLGVAVAVTVAAPQFASGQMRPALGGTTPSGAIDDHLNDATTRSIPQAAAPTIPAPEPTCDTERNHKVQCTYR